MKHRATIYARLWVAFGVLVVGFAVASYVALSALSEVGQRQRSSGLNMHALHAALNLEGAVRDQYIHQAHTIIIGDRSHLSHYEEAKEAVNASLKGIRGMLAQTAPKELDEIDKAHQELDQIFYQEIVPNITRGNTSAVQSAHNHAEELVEQIIGSSSRLVMALEAEILNNDTRVEELRAQTYWQTLALLSGASLFALIIGVYLGRTIIGPIQKLEAGVSRLGLGELDARVSVDSDDELGRLAMRFNEMAGTLKENQETIVRAEKLAGIGRLAAGVAHEINNPLGVILGYTRILSKKLESPQEELGIIEEEVARCQEIVRGLLDLSRPTKLQLQRIELRDLVEEVSERLSGLHSLSEQIKIIGAPLFVEGDALRLRQVLLNVLNNAIEAAGAEATISVTLKQDQKQAVISIQDNGPGLSPEAQEKLFEPFFTTKPKGTGLGLAVTRSIMQAHGGKIEAHNLPDGGANVEISIPL